jgi:hypothetical protein
MSKREMPVDKQSKRERERRGVEKSVFYLAIILLLPTKLGR